MKSPLFEPVLSLPLSLLPSACLSFYTERQTKGGFLPVPVSYSLPLALPSLPPSFPASLASSCGMSEGGTIKSPKKTSRSETA